MKSLAFADCLAAPGVGARTLADVSTVTAGLVNRLGFPLEMTGLNTLFVQTQVAAFKTLTSRRHLVGTEQHHPGNLDVFRVPRRPHRGQLLSNAVRHRRSNVLVFCVHSEAFGVDVMRALVRAEPITTPRVTVHTVVLHRFGKKQEPIGDSVRMIGIRFSLLPLRKRGCHRDV